MDRERISYGGQHVEPLWNIICTVVRANGASGVPYSGEHVELLRKHLEQVRNI